MKKVHLNGYIGSCEFISKKLKWSRYGPDVAQRVGRGIALLFHDRVTRRAWVVSSTPRLHFTPGKDPVPILQETAWAPGPVWTCGKSRPHRDSIPERPVRSQSLHWLSYPAHEFISIFPFYMYTRVHFSCLCSKSVFISIYCLTSEILKLFQSYYCFQFMSDSPSPWYSAFVKCMCFFVLLSTVWPLRRFCTSVLSGAFAKLLKATISFVMSVRLSASNKSARTGRIFMMYGIWIFFFLENVSRKFKFH